MSSGATAVAQATAPPDAEVVQRARQGDHEAFRVLVERYQGRAYGLAAAGGRLFVSTDRGHIYCFGPRR